jgi:hypothetical protein
MWGALSTALLVGLACVIPPGAPFRVRVYDVLSATYSFSAILQA